MSNRSKTKQRAFVYSLEGRKGPSGRCGRGEALLILWGREVSAGEWRGQCCLLWQPVASGLKAERGYD
jgi:hypothetical protein